MAIDLDALEAVLAGDTLAGYTAVYDAAPALIAEHRAALARVAALEGEVTRLRDMVDWIGHDRRLSLAHYSPVYCEDDDQSEEWRVEKQTGSINDREWTVVGRGQTPSNAISAARAALEPKP